MKYILNILPSNIAQDEQLNHPSSRRQMILLDMNLHKLLFLLINCLFPNIEKEPTAIKTFLVESCKHSSDKFKWVEKHALKREDKLYLYHLLKRLDILDLCFRLLNCVCLENTKASVTISQNLSLLVKFLGLLSSVSECLDTIVKDNKEILFQFSKLTSGQSANRAASTLGVEFFDSVISSMKQFKKYTRVDIL